jgi:tape measure domain-containing protein
MAPERIEVWLRMRDARRFQSDAKGSASALRSISSAAGSRVWGRFNTGLQGARQQLAGIGTATKVAGAGFVAMGAVSGKMGLNFNATMESNTVAFTNFLGSTKRATVFLDDLYQMAAKTPFEFPELAGAARKFLAFGFTADETKKTLNTVGDAVAGIGGGTEEIQRLVMSLGQIQAKGKLSTEELMQMAELGIPAFGILRKEFDMTGKELEKALRTGAIGADKGIAALTKGMDERFKGSSAAQAKTFQGQWSTIKDNFNKFMGDVTKPLFNILKSDVFPFLNQMIQGALPLFEDLMNALKPMAPFIENVVLPLLKGFAIGIGSMLVGAIKIAIFGIGILAKALGFIGEFLAPLKPAFEVIGYLLSFFFGGAIIKAVIKGVAGFVALLRVLARPLSIAGQTMGTLGKYFGMLPGPVQAVAKIIMFVAGGPFLFLIRNATKLGFLLRGLSFIGRTVGRVFQFVTRIYAGVGQAVLRVGAMIGGKLMPVLRLLPAPFQRAGAIAGKVWEVIKKGAVGVVLAIAGMPAKIKNAASGMFDGIKEAFRSAINFVIGAWNNLGFHVKGPGPLPDINIDTPNIPLLGMGGTITRSGPTIMNEFGPELLNLPTGAKVTPLVSPPGPIDLSEMSRGGGGGKKVIQLVVGRRVLADAVIDDFEDRKALT